MPIDKQYLEKIINEYDSAKGLKKQLAGIFGVGGRNHWVDRLNATLIMSPTEQLEGGLRVVLKDWKTQRYEPKVVKHGENEKFSDRVCQLFENHITSDGEQIADISAFIKTEIDQDPSVFSVFYQVSSDFS